MTRTTAPLTVDHLALLDMPCRDCVFWEVDPVRRRRSNPEQRAGLKEGWVSELLRDWGSCGRVVLIDGEPVGYLSYAPPAYVPGAEVHPTAPISADAVQLITAYVHPAHRGNGYGRLLVQAMARDLTGRDGVRAVEAFATALPVTGCRVPMEFLARTGFKTHRAHPITPRMRMDLRTLVTWRSGVETALGRLVGVVRPTAPAGSQRQLSR